MDLPAIARWLGRIHFRTLPTWTNLDKTPTREKSPPFIGNQPTPESSTTLTRWTPQHLQEKARPERVFGPVARKDPHPSRAERYCPLPKGPKA